MNASKVHTMRSCCDGLQHLIERAGSTGFSVELITGEIPAIFVVQFRSHTVEREPILDQFLAEHPETPSLTLGGRIPLNYCPWCGKNLQWLLV